MNLITLILLADLVESVGGVSTVLAIISFVATLFSTIAYFGSKSCLHEYSEGEMMYASYLSMCNSAKFMLKIAIPVFILCLALKAILPKKQTIYIIAGIKTTENIVNSEIGKKTQELLMKKIEEYIEKENK